jgi:hypothetical protein
MEIEKPPETETPKADTTATLQSVAAQKHLIITIHGIRTYGKWQERLETLVKAVEPNCDFRHYHFNYFSLIAFITPFARWLVTLKFRNWLLDEAQSFRQLSRIDIVAHSFGTHMAAWALKRLAARCEIRIDTVLLAGSVLRPSFPWHQLLRKHVRRVVNDAGCDDRVLVCNQVFVLFTGMAGRVGFVGGTSERMRNRFHNHIGHSGYFQSKDGQPDDSFMQRWWVPLLTTTAPAELIDERPDLNALSGVVAFLLNNIEPIKVTAWIVIFATPLVIYANLYYQAEEQRKLAISRELANASLLELPYDPDRAIGLARTAVVTSPSVEAKRALAKTLLGRRCSAVLAAKKNVSAIACSSRHNSLIIGYEDGQARIVNRSNLQQVGRTLSHSGPVTAIIFDFKGQRLLTEAGDGHFLWDASTGSPIGQLAKPSRLLNSTNMASPKPIFSPDGKYIAGMSWGNACIWSSETGELVKVLTSAMNMDALQFAVDGERLVTACDGGHIFVWSVENWEQEAELNPPHAFGRTLAAFDNDDPPQIVSVSQAGLLDVWRCPPIDGSVGVAWLYLNGCGGGRISKCSRFDFFRSRPKTTQCCTSSNALHADGRWQRATLGGQPINVGLDKEHLAVGHGS